MKSVLQEKLKKDGATYVRWAFAGSGGESVIAEIKVYGADGNELEGLDYDDDSQFLDYGDQIVDEKHGHYYEYDGGYGWILWDAVSDVLWTTFKFNELGMGSAGFDPKRYDRLEIKVIQGPSEGNALGVISASVFSEDNNRVVELTRQQVSEFIEGKLVPAKKRGVNAASGHMEFSIDGKALCGVLKRLGITYSEKLSFFTNNGRSESIDDFLRVQGFRVFDFNIGGVVATIFLRGWHNDFMDDSMDESDVIVRNPDFDAIKNDTI